MDDLFYFSVIFYWFLISNRPCTPIWSMLWLTPKVLVLPNSKWRGQFFFRIYCKDPKRILAEVLEKKNKKKFTRLVMAVVLLRRSILTLPWDAIHIPDLYIIAVDTSYPHYWFCCGFQCVLPYYVATKLSKIRKPNVFAPGPTTYVRQALGTVGVESRTMGFWSHALQVCVSI